MNIGANFTNFDLISSREPDDDSYSFGAHLILDHGCHEREDLNSSYEIFILKHCSPRALEECEHRFIQSLRTIKPFGINSVDPFGLPLLDPPSVSLAFRFYISQYFQVLQLINSYQFLI
jgi:hypothetical protein